MKPAEMENFLDDMRDPGAQAAPVNLGSCCPGCDGDGEVYVGSSCPDDEGYDECVTCGGAGKLPTLDELREIRQRLGSAEADVFVLKLELRRWKEREKEMSENDSRET